MKRLLPAALIALACHGLIFLLQPLETQPPHLKAARRPVNINLAHFVPTAPKVQEQIQPPKPKPPEVTPPPAKVSKPKPKPRPKPKPKTPIKKQAPKPQPKPDPPPVAPEPEPAETHTAVDEAPSETPPPIETTPVATEMATEEDPGPPQQAPLVAATPLYDHKPLPPYPRSAKRRGHQGTVLLSVHVDATGRVGDLKVKTSSGFTVLDKAALKAVRTWLFKSGRRGDTPVAMWVEVPIQFALN